MEEVAKWAWLAGFFDGEGAVTIRGAGQDKNRVPSPYCTLSQVVRGPLEKAISIVGGGKIRREGNRKIFRVSFYGSDFRAMMRGTIPYLTVKRDRAILALAMSERRSIGGNFNKPLTRLDLFTIAAMRSLNVRGNREDDSLSRVEKSFGMTVTELVAIFDLASISLRSRFDLGG